VYKNGEWKTVRQHGDELDADEERS